MKNKALGPDKIPVILWKDPNFYQPLFHLCNFAFVNNLSPSIWLESQIIPIPKKGDLTLPTNYRGISLLPIAAKLYNKLILNRLRPKIEPILRKNQNSQINPRPNPYFGLIRVNLKATALKAENSWGGAVMKPP